MSNILNKFKNHYNSLKSLKKEDIPKEIMNKFPVWLDLKDSDFIYSGVDSERNFNNHWTFDYETALAFSKNYDNGKVIKMKISDLKEKFNFVSIDLLNEWIENKTGNKNDFYVSESEIYILDKNNINENKLKLKSRVDIINKEKEEFIKNINVEKINKLFDIYGNEIIVDKFLNETPTEYKRKLNYLVNIFFNNVKPKNIEKYIFKFIDTVGEKINNYSMDKIIDEVYLNNLNKELIFNKLKEIDEKMFNNVLRLNYWFKKNINEGLNIKSRANDIQKDKEEQLERIFNKGIENFDKYDLIFIERLDEEKKFFLELKKYLDTLKIPSVLTSLTVHGLTLVINEHFFLKLFYGKLKLWLVSRIKNDKLTNRFFSLSFTHKVEQDGMYLNFYNTKDLVEVLKLLNDYTINEGLNIKSRANEINKDKEEFINNILNKGIRNLTPIELRNIIDLDETKKELFFNELIKEFGEDFNYEKERNSITFDISHKLTKGDGRNFRFNIPSQSFDFSYSKLERRNLPNGFSYTAPTRVFNSVKTFNELIERGHEILNKPMSINESVESRINKFTEFANKVAAKMGINTINYLDSGFFGSAFDIGENKILKITTDKSEALNAKKVKGINTNFIAKVYDVKGFMFEDNEYYFIILEKVRTDFKYLNGIIENLISWFDENNDEDFIDFITNSEFNNIKNIEIELYNDNKTLYNYFMNFVELKKELTKYNITSSDFVNGANLGFRGKRIVAFDLGISDDDGDVENFKLFEGIELKSRANHIQKEKEKIINDILNGKSFFEINQEQRKKLFDFDWTSLRPIFQKIKDIYGEKNLISGKYYGLEKNPIILMKIGNNVNVMLDSNGFLSVTWGLKKVTCSDLNEVLKVLDTLEEPYHLNL